MLNNIYLLFPDLFLSITVSLQLILIAVLSKKDKRVSQVFKTLLITILSLFIASYMYLSSGLNITEVLIGGGILKTNALIEICKAFLCFMGGCVLILNYSYKSYNKLELLEVSLIINLCVIGFLIICNSNDLLILYLGIELYSLSFYVLATINRWSQKSTEAGLKYFVLGSLASGLYLFGTSIIYFITGELNYNGIYAYIASGEISNLLITGCYFLLIGLLFKIAAAPLHMWAPDVYEGAPLLITALFATIPKLPLLVALINLLYGPLVTMFYEIQPLIITCVVFSMLIGSIAGLNQIKLKRLIAYSSISHVGFILLGLSLGTTAGVKASLIYVFIYSITTIALFAVIFLFIKKTDYITEIAGYGKRNPILALSLSLLLFSIAGVPPLAGFYSKFLILYESLNKGFYFLTIIAVISSTIALIYYIRITKWMFFKDSKEYNLKIISDIIQPGENLNFAHVLILGIFLFLVISFLLYPSIWIKLINYILISSLIKAWWLSGRKQLSWKQ